MSVTLLHFSTSPWEVVVIIRIPFLVHQPLSLDGHTWITRLKGWSSLHCMVHHTIVYACTEPSLDLLVMEWSGRCCRHSASHSGKSEITAGSIQQQWDFIRQTKPAQIQQTHAAKHTYWAQAAKKTNKWYNWFIPLDNQISEICVSLALFNSTICWKLHNQLSQIR